MVTRLLIIKRNRGEEHLRITEKGRAPHDVTMMKEGHMASLRTLWSSLLSERSGLRRTSDQGLIGRSTLTYSFHSYQVTYIHSINIRLNPEAYRISLPSR